MTGSHRYFVNYSGPGGHSFGAFGTPSAIHAMGRGIAKIADVKVPEVPKTTHRRAGSQPQDALIVQSGWASAQSIALQPRLADPSSTDSNYPMSLDIPSLTLRGGGVAEGTHSPDECFDPTDAYLGPQQSFMTILGLVGVNGVSQPLLPDQFS